MLLGTLGASLLGNILERKGEMKSEKGRSEQASIFYAALSFNYFWKTKELSKWT